MAEWLGRWNCDSEAPSSSPRPNSVLAGFVLSDPECKIANWFASGQLEILNPQRATMKSTDVTETVLPL